MADAGRTQVVIHGRTYQLAGADPEHTRALARMVDATISRFADALPGSDPYQLAILAALHLADESFSAKSDLDAFQSRVDASARRILTALDAGTGPEPADEASGSEPDGSALPTGSHGPA